MALDDLASRMKPGRAGAAGKPPAIDPDQIMAEARQAAARAERLSDLVLGPILLLGGAGIAALCYLVATQGGLMYGMAIAALIAIVVGSKKLLRGIGLLER
jgi:hypothetical protein